MDRSNMSRPARNRSRERYRLAFLYGSTSLIGKAISIGTSILTVRLTFRYLGAERYGMWMTISSIVLMMGFADLGMSSGLVNLIADAVGREDRAGAERAAASAFWMLSGMAAILSLILLAAYPFVDKARIFNVQSSLAIQESGSAFLVLFFCFVANLPLATVRSVQTGLQKGFINSLWAIVGTISSLGALLIAIHLHAGLPVLVASLSGPPVLASLLNGLELFCWSHPELLPRVSAFSREAAMRLFRTGIMFFLLQLSLSIGMQTDNIVIAQIMGAKAVADYAIPARLFNVITALLVMTSGALWPAYADAFARSESGWIRKAFIRVTTVGTVVTIAITVVLVLCGNSLLRVWIGPQVKASTSLLVVFAVQCILNAYLQPITFLLNGIGKFREQVTTGVLMAIVNLGLSIVLVKQYGILGAVLGTVISLGLVVVIPLTIVTRRTLQGLQLPNKEEDFAAKTEVQYDQDTSC
jgi:O-antigen/teichoic acid export membrane protein